MKLIEKPYLSTTTPKTTTTIDAAKKAQILPVILFIKSKKEEIDFNTFIIKVHIIPYVNLSKLIKIRSWCLLYFRKAVPHAG
jgi:hypothetical protein